MIEPNDSELRVTDQEALEKDIEDLVVKYADGLQLQAEQILRPSYPILVRSTETANIISVVVNGVSMVSFVAPPRAIWLTGLAYYDDLPEAKE